MSFDPRQHARRAALAEKAESAWHGGTLGQQDPEQVRKSIEKEFTLTGGITHAEVWAICGPASGDHDETLRRWAEAYERLVAGRRR